MACEIGLISGHYPDLIVQCSRTKRLKRFLNGENWLVSNRKGNRFSQTQLFFWWVYMNYLDFLLWNRLRTPPKKDKSRTTLTFDCQSAQQQSPRTNARLAFNSLFPWLMSHLWHPQRPLSMMTVEVAPRRPPLDLIGGKGGQTLSDSCSTRIWKTCINQLISVGKQLNTG